MDPGENLYVSARQKTLQKFREQAKKGFREDVTPFQGSSFSHLSPQEGVAKGTDLHPYDPLSPTPLPAGEGLLRHPPQGVALGWYVTPFQGWVPKSGAGEVAKTAGV